MLLSLTNAPRDYAWGSKTLLAALEGRVPAELPEAEVWFGDHAGDPADLPDGRTLDAVTGGELPFLLKLLAAEDPLSIQVHPTKAQAVEGFAREAELAADAPGRNYRDDNHKPELIVPLSERFEALCGLRELAASRRLLAELRSSTEESAGLSRLSALLDGEDDPLRAALQWALAEATSAEVAGVIDAVHGGVAAEFAQTLVAIREIAARNPGDPGVIVALLMNFVVLRRGEAVFLRAGLLHAYVSGLGVEIMAASDNVLRGGLTPKHIDVAELLTIVDTTPGDVEIIRPDPGLTVQRFPVPVDDFALSRVVLSGEDVVIDVQAPAMVLATSGDVRVIGADALALPVPVGTAVFADAAESTLVLSGVGEVFVAEPGSH